MMQTLIRLSAIASVNAAMLPSFHIASSNADSARSNAKWWARVGDQVYVSPPSVLQLSQNVSDYYYALGSQSALTNEMRKYRVGGHGRWNIFHLPEGPAMLQTSSLGARRATLSALTQLQQGAVLADSFPDYHAPSTYSYPGSNAMQDQERTIGSRITQEIVKDYLSKLVELPGGGKHTRSYSNSEATEAAQHFLQKSFKAMNLTTCLQPFGSASSKLANVVAYLPGATRDTVTVGAHYDSRPYQGAAPGAEDNGSGVAALLAVAKAFMQAGLKPAKSLYFVGFAAEEAGCLGSAAFVGALTGASLPTACSPPASFLQGGFLQSRKSPPQHSAIVLDEVGWKSPALSAPTVNLESLDSSRVVMDQLAAASLLHNGAAVKVVHNNRPFGSDHMSFLNKGIPGVLVINGDDANYPQYHQSSDTIDHVDMKYATELSRMVFGGMVRLVGLQQ